MSKTFTTIAVIVILASMAVSCQKEYIIDQPAIVSAGSATYTVQYAIDGESHTATLIGEDTWHDFLNHIFALAEEGHVVSFRNVDTAASTAAAKEAVTYSTTSKDEAYTWAEKMHKAGYSVTILYDEKENTYTCHAIK